jgi:hypothetical protein
MVDWLKPDEFLAPPDAPVADILREPGKTFGVGLPRGFVLSGQNLPCDDSSSAFIRGVLLPQSQYNAMSIDQRLALDNPHSYPMWRLYGGPLSTRALANDWDRWMYFWAFNNGQVWISHGTPCIAPGWAVQWPPDQSFRWEWVWENNQGKIANRYYDAQQGKNVVVVV